MIVLAISTSSNICSVALSNENECIKELNITDTKTHSENLMPLIDRVLKEANLTLDDINLLACDVGPGSFTGIRIGISTIKAFAEFKNIPIIPVSSLEALAYNVKAEKYICSLIDARNNQVYCGFFNSEYNLIDEYIADSIENVKEKFTKFDEVEFVGDGVICHQEILLGKCCKDNIIKAQNVAKCGLNKLKQGKNSISADELTPLYLRKSQAERQKNV